MELVGISRSKQFSPNQTGNDTQIFHLTIEKLIAKGCKIREYSEDEFITKELPYQYYFGMYRDKRSVAKMKILEQKGCFSINTARGIESCYRNNMTQTLIKHKIPYPKSKIVSINQDVTKAIDELGGENVWIKRGDFHAEQEEDVSFCKNSKEWNTLLRKFSRRNIQSVTISEHIEGDLVKFYGVMGTNFFYWFYPIDMNYTKFNQEIINGKTRHYPFTEKKFQSICQKAAFSLGIQIYGGDAIISSTGAIHLIDLNDWPSFAPCREKASEAIAECIYRNFKTLSYYGQNKLCINAEI